MPRKPRATPKLTVTARPSANELPRERLEAGIAAFVRILAARALAEHRRQQQDAESTEGDSTP